MAPSQRTVIAAVGFAIGVSAAFSYVAWSDGLSQRAALCRDALDRRRATEAAYLGSTVSAARSGWASPLEDAYVRALTDSRSYCR